MTVWNKYRERKAKELITIEKIAPKEALPHDAQVAYKVFSPDDGAFIKWELVPFEIKNLDNHKLQLTEAIKDVDALIADLGKLEAVAP